MLENSDSYETLGASSEALEPDNEQGEMNSLFQELKSRKSGKVAGAAPNPAGPTAGPEQAMQMGEMDPEELSAADRKKCELNAALIALTIESTACIGLQFLADDFSEESEKKYSLSTEKMRKYKEAWTELMIYYNGEKISPVWGVILATGGMYLPIIIHAGKQRLKKKKEAAENRAKHEAKSNPDQKEAKVIAMEIEDQSFGIPDELKENPNRDSRGAKTGRRQAPDGTMQMYVGIHPELGPVYPWESDKMKKSGYKSDWKLDKEAKKGWEERTAKKKAKKEGDK